MCVARVCAHAPPIDDTHALPEATFSCVNLKPSLQHLAPPSTSAREMNKQEGKRKQAGDLVENRIQLKEQQSPGVEEQQYKHRLPLMWGQTTAFPPQDK